MKLLTIPSFTRESLGFDFLGCHVTMPFKGRKIWQDVEIDFGFGGKDAEAECLIKDGKPTQKNMETWVLYKDTNHSFVFRNLWPYRNVRGNVWLCRFSHAEPGHCWSW